MIKYKLTFPRAILFLVISVAGIVYMINNYPKMGGIKSIVSIILTLTLLYLSLNHIIKAIRGK